jgi:cell division protein FtsB
VGGGRLDRVLGRRARAPSTAQLRSIHDRMNALEAMIEGLQDSVDRQARRQDERLAELARQIEPAELARALSDDARKRGI